MIWFCSLWVALASDILWICSLLCTTDCLAWLYSLDHLSHGTIFLKYNLVQYTIKNRISYYLVQLCFWRASQDKSWVRTTSFLHGIPLHRADFWSSIELGAKPLDPPLPRKKSSPSLDRVEALEGPCPRSNVNLCITINVYTNGAIHMLKHYVHVQIPCWIRATVNAFFS